jgi:hypothetical protein
MAWIDGKTLRLFLPALTDVFIGGQALEGFESLGRVLSQLEGVEMVLQVLVGLVRVFLHGGLFEGAIHPFTLAVRPRMVTLGQAVLDAVLTADTREDMTEGVLIVASVGKLDAVVGQHGVDLVRLGGDQVAQEWRRHHLGRFGVQLGIRILAGPVDGHEEP